VIVPSREKPAQWRQRRGVARRGDGNAENEEEDDDDAALGRMDGMGVLQEEEDGEGEATVAAMDRGRTIDEEAMENKTKKPCTEKLD
jgi:hypothetical protein